ncbi:MAG: hypothetical protein Q8L37_05280 [Candidatus Gottesmanbacteria bacterium]|nr:hypothetical protein [Candidatus Gottesmanbacteria bacterium]
MANEPLPTTIPPELHRFFWDVDAVKLNPSEHPLYVINRLLDKGDLAAARWVLRSFPNETVKETFRKRRDFSPWNGRFWAHYLTLSEKEVACLEPSYLKQRRQLWPH